MKHRDHSEQVTQRLFHPTLHHIAPPDPHWHTRYLDIWNSVTHGNSTTTKTLVNLEISYIQSSHIWGLITWVGRYSVLNSLFYLGTFIVWKEFHTTFINQWSRVQCTGVSCWLHRSKGPRASTPDIMLWLQCSAHTSDTLSPRQRDTHAELADHEWNFEHKLN